MARTTLGEQLVQGVDYAYTLQGWLKGINSTGGAIAADAGSDGVSGGLNQFTARDALGLTLNYFEGDYRNLRAPAINPFPDYTSGMDIESPYRPLFNGNISSMSVYNRKFEAGVAGGPLVFNNYKYDQLNRLTRMDVYATSDFYTNGWDNMSIPGTKPMEERVSYDANGNLLGYIRNGITATPIGMDTLEYRYYPGTNQLMQIGDKVPADRYGSNSWEVILDIDSQAHVNNYIYDEIGNLITDSAEKINSIKWSVYGKILEIRRESTDKVPITFIRYTYDALGNRISKVFNLGGDTLYTWYVRDAQGNMLSIYTSQINVPHTPSDLNISQGERYIYGSSRVGVYNLGSSVDGGPGSTEFYNTNTFYRGWKQYELSNHLGNVLVTLSDKKFGVSSMGSLTHYEPDMTSGNDYYPFGMLSRIATSSVGTYYRHGFNGKEFDWEAKGWQNQYDYGERIYDPRSARFLSVDPITDEYPELTPYQFASNTPIQAIDLDGLEAARRTTTNTTTGRGGRTRVMTEVEAMARATGQRLARGHQILEQRAARQEIARQNRLGIREIMRRLERAMKDYGHGAFKRAEKEFAPSGPIVKPPHELSDAYAYATQGSKGLAKNNAPQEIAEPPAPQTSNAGGSGNFVYRGLSAADIKSIEAGEGISARNPNAINSVFSHVAGRKDSRWISTTKSEEIAKEKFGEKGYIKIDLSKVSSDKVDLSKGFSHQRGRFSNYAKKDQEVLIEKHIPQSAIIKQ